MCSATAVRMPRIRRVALICCEASNTNANITVMATATKTETVKP
jgi:hypothetical protein